MRTSPVLKSIDYSDMDKQFSNERAIKYNEILGPSVSLQDFNDLISQLPERERDLIDLYYKERKNQKDIAKMFGVTQGAISSRLTRAKARLKFLRKMPKITKEEIETALKSYFNILEIEIIKFMMETTCQSKTAQLLNEKFEFLGDKKKMTQVKVRHRFLKCIDRLKMERKRNRELDQYYKLLKYIRDNLYKLHEVKLPHFDRGASVIFSMSI